MNEIIYTQDQELGLGKISKFLQSDHPLFLLKGSAGTGKTFLTQAVVAELAPSTVVGLGPTHKAVGVLATRMPDVTCMTGHSFLGLRPRRREDRQDLVRKPNYDASENYAVRKVIFDEGSMVDSNLKKYIEEDYITWGRKYIILMDDYQLPPVGELYSPYTSVEYTTADLADQLSHELFEIRRHSGPIVVTATKVRDAIIAKKEPEIVGGVAEDGSGVHLLPRSKWEAYLEKMAKHDDFNTDPDFCRIISYKNETVHSYNAMVRGILGHFCAILGRGHGNR